MTQDFHTLIRQHMAQRPDQIAVAIPKTWSKGDALAMESLSYGQLEDMVLKLISGLKSQGIQEGDRIVLLFPVSVSMIALMIALFAIGAVPTFIDPGMGMNLALKALKGSGCRAIVSLPKVLKLLRFIPPFHKLKRLSFDPSDEVPLKALYGEALRSWPEYCPPSHGEGIITFTSGTTGIPKAANRTLKILQAQHEALSHIWTPQPGEAVLNCFPIASLFFLAHGASCILPKGDIGSPESIDPQQVMKQLEDHKINCILSAPAFLEKLTHCLREQGYPKCLHTIATGGGPVPFRLIEDIRNLSQDIRSLIIYGSTEAEPIATIAVGDAGKFAPKMGYPVGKVVADTKVRILRTNSKHLHHQSSEDRLLELQTAPFEVGELVVSGDHVVGEYLNHPTANQSTKIRTPEGALWHRTGDLAYWNYDGQVFLVGRDKDIIHVDGNTIYPFPLEAQLDLIAGVHRSALIERNDEAVLFLQLSKGARQDLVEASVKKILQSLATQLSIYYISKIPVDSRHNSKINRSALKLL